MGSQHNNHTTSDHGRGDALSRKSLDATQPSSHHNHHNHPLPYHLIIITISSIISHFV